MDIHVVKLIEQRDQTEMGLSLASLLSKPESKPVSALRLTDQNRRRPIQPTN